MKKCLICDDGASFAIKDSKDYYCKECAEEQFGDISYLVSIEDNENKEKRVEDSEVVEENNNSEEVFEE